jgi:hypothetical protein
MDIFHEIDDRETTAIKPTYEQQERVALYQCTVTIILPNISTMLPYTEMGPFYNIYSFFNFADWFHSSELHGDQGAACREEHMNFVDESACLMAENVPNEGK